MYGDMTITAGVVAILAGVGLTFRQIGRRLWWAREARARSAQYVEGFGELASQALFWGGGVLIQLGNLAGHIKAGTLARNPWLSLSATAAALLVFGFVIGRLYMRWQLRILLASFDNASVTP